MSRDREKAIERQRRHRLRKKIEKYGSEAASIDMRGRHGNHARGAKNGKWGDGRSVNTDGYIKVRVGRGHPLADPNGYAYEHLLVWVAAGRPRPTKNQTLHHRDEDKSNNRLANLELLTRTNHAKIHNSKRHRDDAGRFIGSSSNAASEYPR